MLPLLRSLFRDRRVLKRIRRQTAAVPYGRRPTFENLERRAMLAVTLLNTPTWVEQGPGPITSTPGVDLNGDFHVDPGDVAVGAVEAIAVDPTDASHGHVFIGTTNGGIWQTSNVNAANPVWTTTTDQLPSLAIGAIAFSPVNSRIIYAGTGSFSSARKGGSAVGVYRSLDGGATWTQLGFNTFQGMRIKSIIPTRLNSGATVFVATVDTRGAGTGGIYRSDNSGATWRRLSGAGASQPGSGLPDQVVSHLISFAVNDTTVGFYAGVPGSPAGIYRSTNNGQTWQSISNNIATSVASASRIEFSVSPAFGTPVYAGLLDATGNLINVFRSNQGTDGRDNNGNRLIDEPAEATWQPIAAFPPNIGEGDDLHFAILADSTRADVVYVGGTGDGGDDLLFRGSSTTGSWTSIQLVANNTLPHLDVRDLAFSGPNILRGDDGGIYRLVNPLQLSTLPATTWESAIGNLRNTEIYSVALDNRNNSDPADDIVLAGMQDNGIGERNATGVWKSVGFGDGGSVQAFDGPTLGADAPVHYGTIQDTIAGRIDPTNIIQPLVPSVEGAPLRADGSKLRLDRAFDPNILFITPYQVHATDSNRVLTGTFQKLYESFNRADSYVSLGGLDIVGSSVSAKPVPNLTGNVTSLAYGSEANAEIAYVGTNFGDIFVRTTAGGAFQRTNFSSAVAANEAGIPFAPIEIVLDTKVPQRAYAVTSSAVYKTTNMLDWQPITDNLSSFALPGSTLNLQTIELVNDDTIFNSDDDVILVGGYGGVFRRQVTATPFTNPWCEYGQGLPNVLVTDLEYDLRSDTLVAGTLGRSAWTISNVKSTIGLESKLQVDGTTGPDTVHIVRNANNPLLLDVFLNVIDTPSARPTLEVQLSVVQSVFFLGNNGADRLQISSTGGTVRVPHLLDFIGGNDGSVDTLVLNNASDTQNATGSIFASFINGSLSSPVSFSGVEAITILLGSGSDNIDGSGANVPLTLVGGGGIDILRGGSASDTLDGRDGLGFDQLFGGPGNDTALMDQFDFFDGGLNLDGIDFFGAPGNDHIRVSRQVGPDGPQALIEMNNKQQVFNYVNGETINVYAGAGNDHVEMDASAGTHWKAQFFGQEGNDRLIGGAMDDLLNGGPGNDFLDGAGGDNVLIGGGGHDVLRNGHAPLAAPTLAAASTASVTSSTTRSSSTMLIQASVQFDNRSRQLELSVIDSNNTSLGGYVQNSGTKNLTSSAAILLERNSRSHVLDEILLNALTSGSLSKDNGSLTGTIDRAFAIY